MTRFIPAVRTTGSRTTSFLPDRERARHERERAAYAERARDNAAARHPLSLR
ncbi:hypothetical protein [Antribacter gilvus]|uniref:hypothetical protein n=1 Tax=Antribacter gilvus TaxID=2304675 RepID=UPI0013E09C26|nr:hypothetical protein [Antribacter gilvus]